MPTATTPFPWPRRHMWINSMRIRRMPPFGPMESMWAFQRPNGQQRSGSHEHRRRSRGLPRLASHRPRGGRRKLCHRTNVAGSPEPGKEAWSPTSFDGACLTWRGAQPAGSPSRACGCFGSCRRDRLCDSRIHRRARHGASDGHDVFGRPGTSFGGQTSPNRFSPRPVFRHGSRQALGTCCPHLRGPPRTVQCVLRFGH